MTSSAHFAALGTTATVVTSDCSALPHAVAATKEVIREIDVACSRFRHDSDLMRVNERAGSWVTTSDTFRQALHVALRAAYITNGLVTPTVGTTMELIGYDRTFEELEPSRMRFTATPVHAWEGISINDHNGRVRVPPQVRLDLGATAKAFAADRAAELAFDATKAGVLISLGGDVATAGPAPEGDWTIAVADHHAAADQDQQQRIAIASGAVATSGTQARRWMMGSEIAHHIVDPTTGAPAGGIWRTVSVAAASCVDANIASTAAIILGDAALTWLQGQLLDARLVSHSGGTAYVGRWPVTV